MAGKNTSAFGIYSNSVQADEAVRALLDKGFRPEDVSVLAPDNPGTKDLGHEKHSKGPEGATAGAVAGGLAGGTLGLLAGLGSLAIPGVGPLIAAGPIIGALAGIGTGGTVGGLIAGLIGLGIPEYEAKRYDGLIKEGRVLLSVHCDDSDWVRRAKDLLKTTGAEDISSTGESAADYARSDKPRVRSGGSEL